MAEFIELHDEEEEQGQTTTEPTEQVGQTEEVVKQEEPEVPEKYKGKSLDEIIRMHQEAEKLIGRQAQEVGEVRKLADSLLKQQLEQKHDAQPVKTQEIDWYEDPAKAVKAEIENNPILRELREQTAKQAQMVALQTIEKAHPDFMEVASSNEFAEWVQGSKVRMQLFAQANNYDVDSALELLSTYKSLKAVKQQQTKAADESLKKVEEENRAKTLKAAAVQQGGTGESTKTIYRRADLIRLRMEDPARYEAMADEILAAYNEGRVK